MKSIGIKKSVCVPFIWICVLLLGFVDAFGGPETSEITYPFRIVQVSDTQPVTRDETHFQRVVESIELINPLQPDLVIFPGDITDLGTEQEYKQMKNLLSTIQAPVYYVPGNHDTITPKNEAERALSTEQLHEIKLPLYHKYFGEDHWALEYGDFLFVGFDTTGNEDVFSSSLRPWLLETCMESDKPYTFIVTHYTHSMARNTSLEHTMNSAEVTGYMHGHNHRVEAYTDKGTGRLVFSSGSANRAAEYGLMYFDVYKDSLVCFWKPVNGPVKPLGVFNLAEAAEAVARRKSALDIGPYIQELEPTGVTLKWQCKIESKSEIKFRKQGAETWLEKEGLSESMLHEVKLEGLTPSTTYEYFVDINSTEFGQIKSPVFSFSTPSLEIQDSVTFVVYGDTRSRPLDHRKVATAMADTFGDTAAFCIHTGDLVADGNDFESWSREFFNPAESWAARVPIYPVLGNHEKNSTHYFDFFNLPGNERWYSMDRGPVHMVFLDPYFSSLKPGSDQYKWLKKDLANSTAPWKLVALHTPVFSSGGHARLDKDRVPVESEMADVQQYLIPLFEEYGVSMVFSGHEHMYERSLKSGVHYIVSGGGGAPLYKVETNLEQNPYSQRLIVEYHYCLIEATLDQLHLSVYDTHGKIIEEVSQAGSAASRQK